jgi:hypothetical protein
MFIQRQNVSDFSRLNARRVNLYGIWSRPFDKQGHNRALSYHGSAEVEDRIVLQASVRDLTYSRHSTSMTARSCICRKAL